MSQVQTLQSALAGEHAAQYGVGVAGGKLTGAKARAAESLYEEHRRRRDKLTDLLTAAGEKPVAAAPAYDLPLAVTNAVSATSLILQIERRLAAVYGDLVENAEQDPVRALAVEYLLAVAATQVRWGGGPAAFPGAN
ncbi:ferritin-like domain-containing protein [Kribbella sp. CA-293567]|uniref:ferritin-like domain-containing protein n=1 Tax=Kribbella sp. CA-293567 TaxID=3002436 RepID=UPI0022DD6A47|nr:ferritin-like domain-containing protein [Kribbella sp. CA-293567]WBQ02543.1 ferritin-like domain-containing protein [Kribbella sp. CA-293567]